MTNEQLPTTKIRTTPKDVFLHILGIITLIIAVVSLIELTFGIIAILFHDSLDPYSAIGAFQKARGAIAALIVVWPVHIVICWILGKDIAASSEKGELAVRRWLTHLTLFIAALTIIIDLITLIRNFLNGDLTIAFFLKIFAVLITAGAVFGYYLWDIRRNDAPSNAPRKVAIAVSLILIASIAVGIFYVGSPKKERGRRFDQERANGLQIIQQEIFNQWTQTGKLPKTIADLSNQFTGFVPPTDPETGDAYGYTVKGDNSFELCAIFSDESLEYSLKKGAAPARTYPNPYGNEYNWNHGAGRVCFERKIDPELYKPKTENTVTKPLTIPNLTPEEVLEKYIQADMNGARIGGITQNAGIKNYTIWQSEPGWDEVMIVKNFKIIQEKKITEDEKEVVVQYECAGQGYKYDKNGAPIGMKECIEKKEEVHYRLKQEGEIWKITYPQLQPHISEQTYQIHNPSKA